MHCSSKKLILLLSLSLISLIQGCANLEIRKSRGPDDEGLPYYRPMPYLLISTGEKGYCKSEIIVLPDMSEEYRMIPHAGMGSIDFGPTLTNGWNLTSLNSKVDTQTDENITAISGLISTLASTALLGMSPEKGETRPIIGPGLYRFLYDDQGKYITGIKQVGQMTNDKGELLTCLVATSTGPSNTSTNTDTKPHKTN